MSPIPLWPGILGCLLGAVAILGEEPAKFRPEPGKFPPPEEARSYRGELVFVDHVNRRGSLRLQVDGHFAEGRLHHFALLPYAVVRYRGAPADLRDIPLGTVLHGRFYLPPDSENPVVPPVKGDDVTQPAETHAILLEDGLSLNLREGKSWTLTELQIRGDESQIVATRDRTEGGEGLDGTHTITLDRSTRIWRGRELLGLDDVIADGTWPGEGTRSFEGLPVQLDLCWHPRYLYQQFHASDLWLDEAAVQVAVERQRQRHLRLIRTRWMPARVDDVEYGQFGQATVTATLFGGMDPSLYEDFQAGAFGQMAAAEDTLRTYWPDHDGMEGRFVSVEKTDPDPPLGSSGIQLRMEMDLVLEGFRPGRIVRIRAGEWPRVKPPYEELIKGLENRWPDPGIFPK